LLIAAYCCLLLLPAADCHSEFNRFVCLPMHYSLRFPEFRIQIVNTGTHKVWTQFSSQRSPIPET
jgi:hypothetical protein